MPDWTAYMRRHGFGTDPAGDASRREEMVGATITPEMVAAVRAAENRLLASTFAVPPERIGVDPRVSEEEPYPAPVVAGHELSTRSGLSGTEVTCECGRWDGWYNGPRSRRRVLDDWAAHVAAEARAAGPIRVKAERVDLDPKELE